jgi:competence transcription factor ComK
VTVKRGTTKSIERTWISMVKQHDPDFEAQKRRETEYEFSNGRTFKANPAKRHPYNIDPDP